MTDKNHPCKQDCPRRHGTCRATCPDLAAYNEARKDVIAEREAERRRNNLITDYVKDAVDAVRRRTK